MKTTFFIKLTGTVALIAFITLAFSSCQQAGRNYQRQSSQAYKKSNTIKSYPARRSSSRSSSNCSGGV
ncbi:MAG: hypothetical protein P1V20_23530 [Verrucomicrobiales bacterium]|nr:hypothetical protein [Verrucomicrobiales bacterium]